MSNEQNITIVGRLTGDPELRFVPSGAAVTNFTVAFNPRKFDKNRNEWTEGTTQFWRCNAWNAGKLTMAENIAGVLRKGDAVIVFGSVEGREYEKDGQTRSVLEVRVQHVGKDCLFHGEPQNTPSSQQQSWGAQSDDPWAQPGNAQPPF